MKRTDREIRIKAYNYFNELKEKRISIDKAMKEVMEKFSLSNGTVYGWAKRGLSPYGKRGSVQYRKELFYVLGALLGDGCIYFWRRQYQVWISGDEDFIKKYSFKLSRILNRKVNYYLYKGRYKKYGTKVWFVKVENVQLYLLLKEFKETPQKILEYIRKGESKENSLELIEGFFDAEGCVKIIKEPVRITPKICLDITNTNYGFLELVRILLRDKLSIEARYSVQKPIYEKNKKTAYHLRIYKKDFIRKFFENINTTKLKPEKVPYVENWLNNGK